MRSLPALPTRGNRSYLARRSATHLHRGIDLPAPVGTPVYAVGSGTVTHASATLEPGFSGYGAHVVVSQAPGTHALYAHLDTVAVSPGEHVTRGQLVGTVGRTCYSRAEPERLCGGAHLHFELSPGPYPRGSESPRLDPVAFLRLHGAHPLSSGSPSSPSSPRAPATPRALSFVALAALAAGAAALLAWRR